MSFHFDENGIKNLSHMFFTFFLKKFRASLINFICIILFITTNVRDKDLIKFVAAVVLMCEFKGDRGLLSKPKT